MNEIELASAFASFFIIIIGILFIKDGREEESYISEITFYAMLLINLFFLVRWL